MSAMSNYLENKLIDFIFRGQTFVPPTTTYMGLFTVTPTDGVSGTEVTGGSYIRSSIDSTLINWAGTQSVDNVSESTGTNGTTSNNLAIQFPIPTGDWGRIIGFGMFDGQFGGNLLFYGNLTLPKNVNNGDAAPLFTPASLSIQIDN